MNVMSCWRGLIVGTVGMVAFVAMPAFSQSLSSAAGPLSVAATTTAGAAAHPLLRVEPAGSRDDARVRAALATALATGAPPRTLAEVDAWSVRLTAALRQGGFALGQVLMTQADWGVLTQGGPAVFTVFPGRVSEIVLQNGSRMKEARLRRIITRALCSADAGAPDALKGCLFQTARFERTTQLLQDLPGVGLDGAPQFGPGDGPGDVKVTFKLTQRGKPYTFDAFVDDNGIPATGRTREGISAAADNLLGLGDNYALTLMRTSKDMWTGSFLGSLPILSDGLSASAQFTRSQYTLDVGDTAFVGTSNTYSLGLTYPFTRGLDRNVWGGLSVLHTDARMDYGDYGYTNHSHLDALRVTVSANNGDRAQQLRTDLWNEWHLIKPPAAADARIF